MSKTSRRHSRYVSSRMGKIREARGHREQVVRRACAAARAASARRAAAAAAAAPAPAVSRNLRGEERRGRRAGAVTSASTSSGSGKQEAHVRRLSASGNRTTKPSSVQMVSTSMPSCSRIARRRGHGPGDEHRRRRSGERTQTRQSPSSSLERSTTTVPVVRDGACGGALVGQDTGAGSRRPLVQVVLARPGAIEASSRGSSRQLADQPADAPAQLQRASGAVALPEGHLPRLAWRGRDQHPVVRDLLDAPGRGAEVRRCRRPSTRTPSPRPARRRAPAPGRAPTRKTP